MIKKRQLASIVIFTLVIVGFIIFYIISSIKQTFFTPKPLEYLIQCATLQAKGGQSRLFQIKVYENILNCHALLWKIPPAYFAKKSATDPTPDPVVIQEITIRGSFADDGKLIPYDKNKKTDVPVYPDITLKPSWASFEEMSRIHWFSVATNSRSAKKVASPFKGIAKFDTLEYQYKDVLPRMIFFAPDVDSLPEESWKYTVECTLPTSKKQDTSNTYKLKVIPKNTLCFVTSEVDERIYAKFSIRYSQVAQIKTIVDSVSNTLKQMMLN
jgi:hypothetical protein